VKAVYVLATESKEPVSLEVLAEAFASDEVQFLPKDDGASFLLRADQTEVELKFSLEPNLEAVRQQLTGTQEATAALERAQGYYRVSFSPGKPIASVAVFEALWAVRTLLEHGTGVLVDLSSFKLHSADDVEEITELDFDIRDHLSLHAVEVSETETPYWVHTHGLSKFGVPEVEIFNLAEADLEPAETFLHELATDLSFGQGPAPRLVVTTSVGVDFMLLPADEARTNLFGLHDETFDGHEVGSHTVVSAEGRHSLSEMLRQYRDRFEEESAEVAQARREDAQENLPAFRARFLRRGFMEPLQFLVRAPFEVHPEGDDDTAEEQLWVEIVSWDDDGMVGRLIDGGKSTSEWRRGAHVEIEQGQVNALGLAREGRRLDPHEVKNLLTAEKPM
jgi:hypothetical protein